MKLFCFHFWVESFPQAPMEIIWRYDFDHYLWECQKCGKRIHKPSEWRPINFLEER